MLLSGVEHTNNSVILQLIRNTYVPDLIESSQMCSKGVDAKIETIYTTISVKENFNVNLITQTFNFIDHFIMFVVLKIGPRLCERV